MHHRKLGRVRGVRHPDLPCLSTFLNSVTLPPLPSRQDWYSKISAWGMMLNDRIGCCAIASPGHMVMQESAYACGTELVMSDAEVLKAYETVSGYVPGRPETDVGCYEGNVGTLWLRNGFTIGGQLDKIVGFADLHVQNLDQLKYAVMLTGNAFLGFSLPACAETDEIWDLPRTPQEAQLIGGHAVPVVGYDENYLYIVTWGELKKVTYAFYRTYCEEAHVTLSHRWMNAKGLTPTGIDWSTLVSDTKAFCARVSA